MGCVSGHKEDSPQIGSSDWTDNLFLYNLSQQQFCQTLKQVKSQGLRLPYEFGSHCTTCFARNIGRRLYCFNCRVIFCLPCYHQNAHEETCRRHRTVLYDYPLSQGKQEPLQQLLTKYREPIQCDYCQKQVVSARYRFRLQESQFDCCQHCSPLAGRESECPGVLVLPSRTERSEYVLQRKNRLCMLADLVFSCHRAGLSQLKLCRANLLARRHRLYLIDNKQIVPIDPCWTDKTDMYLAGRTIAQFPGLSRIEQLVAEQCTRLDPGQRPNSLQLHVLLRQLILQAEIDCAI